jgi:hypothetical protein
MSLLDRRRFLQTSAAAAALTSPALRAMAQAKPNAAPLTLHPERNGPQLPASFIGLSYEIQQLEDPQFFSANNTGLIARFRELSSNGVLRLGGNTSDVGWWKPTPASTQPPLPPNVVASVEPGTKPFQQLAYPVTPEAVKNLRAFLDATGWTCLYGINLATNTPERGTEEAAFVYATLGAKLEYFQLGNEPDLFDRRFRDKRTWNADRYLDDWLAMANAIRARVPQARFGLPDTAGDPTWSSRIAERLGAMPPAGTGAAQGQGSRPNIAAVTHHYYFGGPPTNPEVNIQRLLKTDPKVAKVAATTREAAEKLGCVYRMSEGNTCYQGGKPNVSDVLAAALWAADYALSLASFGYAGINLHGGGGKAVGNSLGARMPGEALLKSDEAPHPRPFYTPIADMNGTFVAEPTFRGLQFAGRFAGATMIPINFDPGAANATAYAAKLPTGQLQVAIINKDPDHSVPLNLAGFSPALVLTAPSLESREVNLAEPQANSEANAVPPRTAMLLQNVHG